VWHYIKGLIALRRKFAGPFNVNFEKVFSGHILGTYKVIGPLPNKQLSDVRIHFGPGPNQIPGVAQIQSVW
jgi:hypothetical protein